MQVILSLLRSVNAMMRSAGKRSDTGSVVLMNTRWPSGMQSIITCSASGSENGSPPVNTKSHFGVISWNMRMLSHIFSREKPVMSAYSSLLMQNGQWFLQSYGTNTVTVAPPSRVIYGLWFVIFFTYMG